MTFKLSTAGLAAFALLIIPFAAQGADMPIKAPYYKGAPRSVVAYYNWTGFYAGINGGYAFGSSDWTSPAVSPDPKGFLAGATIGYNWQSGAIVYGLEGDWDWSNVKADATCGAFTCTTKQDWIATARGRIGYAFDRWLPYLTAGGAFASLKASTTNPLFTGASSTQIGWTAGVGLEYAIIGNWTAKIEYLYADLGKFDCGTGCGPLATGNNVSFSESIVRAGLNYKFSGPIFSRF
jgi:outer membrane immunogenic protein